MKSVGNFPQNLAAGGTLNVFVGEAGNLFVAIQNHAQPVAAAAFFEEGVNASGAPQRNHVSLRDDEHGVGKIGEQARGGIETAGGVDDDEAIVIHQQIEQAGQFARRGYRSDKAAAVRREDAGLLWRGHEAIEQRGVEAVQVLQRVEARRTAAAG